MERIEKVLSEGCVRGWNILILVTVGTQKFPYERLIKTIDNLVKEHKIQEKVFMQIGTSQFTPKYCDYERYVPHEELNKKLDECSLLITHSGVGMIISACNRDKPVIVLPRLKKYGEHVDDHQVEIAEAFSEKNYVYYCRDEKDMLEAIKNARQKKYEKYQSKNKKIVNLILNYIENDELS